MPNAVTTEELNAVTPEEIGRRAQAVATLLEEQDPAVEEAAAAFANAVDRLWALAARELEVLARLLRDDPDVARAWLQQTAFLARQRLREERVQRALENRLVLLSWAWMRLGGGIPDSRFANAAEDRVLRLP
jgi:hypothetical protein